MSENDRTGERPAGRPKVKVTDRRRVREEGAAPTTPPSTQSDMPRSEDRPSTPGSELAAARASSWAVLVASAALTLVAGAMIW